MLKKTALENGYLKDLILSYLGMVPILINQKRYKFALLFAEKAKDIANDFNSLEYIALSLNNILVIYKSMNSIEKMNNTLTELEYTETIIGNKMSLASLYYNKSHIRSIK